MVSIPNPAEATSASAHQAVPTPESPAGTGDERAPACGTSMGRSLTFPPHSPGPSRSSWLRILPLCLSRSSAASASCSSPSSRSRRSRRRCSRAAASSASRRTAAALPHTPAVSGTPAPPRDPPDRGRTWAGGRGARSTSPGESRRRRRGRRRGWCSPTAAGCAPPAPAAPPPCAPPAPADRPRCGPTTSTATSQRARSDGSRRGTGPDGLGERGGRRGPAEGGGERRDGRWRGGGDGFGATRRYRALADVRGRCAGS